jgi:prepilin-type N-terminal cleavage/methylation domain-containing protein
MDRKPGDNDSDRAGFTLVELLVVITVTGIMSVIFLRVIQRTTEAVGVNQARSKLMSELSLAGRQLANDLRSKVSHAQMTQRKYRLIGKDGDDKFETDLSTRSRPLNSASEADHLHMHAMNTGERCSTFYGGSERHRYGFFLNSGNHPELMDVNGDGRPQWGLFARDDCFSWDADDIRLNHYNDLQAPLAFNVDYLSFRYLDQDEHRDGNCISKTDGKDANDGWYNEWDSRDDSLDYISYGTEGDYPDAIEFAIRGYHPEGLVDPRWFVLTVDFGYETDCA